MNTYLKPLAVAGVAGVLAIASMSASEARPRGWGAAGVGFAAGALVGAAAASAHNGYYYDDGYAYAPAPAYSGYDAYGYAPQPYYAEPVYTGRSYYRSGNNLRRYQGAAGTGTSD